MCLDYYVTIPKLASFLSAGNGTDTGQADYNAVAFSYGGPAGFDDPNDSVSYYRPSFPVPESLSNKLVSLQSLLSALNIYASCQIIFPLHIFLLILSS